MNMLPLLHCLFTPAARPRSRRRFPAEALEARIAPAANAWIGVASGDWTDPANWSDGVPTADDDVTIDPTGVLTITIGSGAQVANSLIVPGDDTLEITRGSLTLTSASSVSNLTLAGGSLNAGPRLALTGLGSFTGIASIDGSVRNEGAFAISGTPDLLGTIDNAGTITDSGRLDFIGTGRLNNLVGGVFEVAQVGGGAFASGLSTVPGFFNSGILRLTQSGTSSVGVGYNNLAGGIIAVNAGTLSLNSDGIWEGADLQIAAGAEVLLGTGNKAWTGAYTGSGGGVFRLSGGIQGASAGAQLVIGQGAGVSVNFPAGFFEFSGNAGISGGALTNLGTMDISGFPNLAATIDNAGTIRHSGRIDFNDNGRINNLVGGVYEIASGFNGTAALGTNLTPGFFNAGTIRHIGAITTTLNIDFSNMAGGVVAATAGELAFNRDGTWGSTDFRISPGAEVTLSGGNVTWAGDFAGSGGGVLRLGRGIHGASAGGHVTADAGGATLNFPAGFFEFSGNAKIDGGVVTNVGEITIADRPDLGTTIDSSGKIINRGQLDFLTGGRINNLASGVLEIAKVGGGSVTSGASTVPGIFNAGILRHTEAGTSTITVPFGNLAGGIIEAAAGTLALHSDGIWESANFLIGAGSEVTLNSGAKIWTGAYTGSGGGILRLGGGTQGASAGGLVTIGAAGATFDFPADFFQFSNNARLDGGTLDNLGAITVSDRADLGLTINNSGTIRDLGQPDFLAGGQINNLVGGVFEVAKAAGGSFASGAASVPGFFNAGTFVLSIDADVSTSVPFSNTGLVLASAGALSITGPVAQIVNSELTDGTWEVADGASLLISRTFATNSATLIQHGTGVIGSIGGSLTTNQGSIQLVDGAALTLTRDFTNAGALAIGSGSLLTTTGTFNQTASGRTEFGLGGSPANGQFGRLAVGGAAGLDGVAAFVIEGGFVPQLGDSFPLATFGGKSGVFSSYEGLAIDQNLFLSPVLTDASLVVNVLDAPPNAQTVDKKNSFRFTDADGDTVKIKLKGAGSARVSLVGDAADNAGIEFIDLTGATGKTKLSISVKSKSGGDGLVNVGAIDASGLTLKSVKIKGDLGKIDIGDGVEGSRAIGKLAVNSIGAGAAPRAFANGGVESGAGVGAAPESNIAGSIGVLSVKIDVKGVLNVTGGLADDAGLSGSVVKAIGKVAIGGNIDGSAGGETAGLLRVRGDIGSVKVKGSVMGGADLSGIVAGGSIGKIKVGGSVTSPDPDMPVTISALGAIGASSAKEATALKSVKVGGDVLNAEILAGFRRNGVAANADAGIGKIIVDGNWTASSVAAGVEDVTGDGYGVNDALIAGGSSSILSRIAKIAILGAATGSDAAGDHYGITAEQIGELKQGRARQPLNPGDGDVINIAPNFTLVDFA